MEQTTKTEPTAPKSKNRFFIPIIFLLVVVGSGFWYWNTFMRGYITTDDALVDSYQSTISPKILGKVSVLAAKEGDFVKAGQLLVQLDQTDILNSAHQAEATLVSSQAKLNTSKAGSRSQQIATAQAQVNQTQVAYDLAKKNYERMSSLYSQNLISKQQAEIAENQLAQAEAGLNAAKNTLSMVEEGSTKEQIAEAEAGVIVAEAGLQTAKGQLLNTVIKAPFDGVISKRWVMPGDVVQPSQPIFSLFDIKNVWITADFEETKLSSLHVGQIVEILVDAYPGVKFAGHVKELGTSTASQFSLIPANNASGNFTKVTQRVPIKIAIDTHIPSKPLLPGMSVEVKVKVN